MKKYKEKDNKNKKLFSASKVWAILNFDNCGALCCIYSNNAVCNKGGSTNKDMGHLEIWKETSSVCRNKVHVQGFVVKQVIRCGEPIESKCYNNNGTRSGIIITEDVYLLC